jgi:uncharacterized PurR-regulated membrane protein YhhQ (DUF165 family)
LKQLFPPHAWFAVLGMIGVVASSNYLVQISINEWLTWGAFSYPFSFLITELTNRFYGPKTARRVVLFGFIAAIALAFSWMNQRIAFASSIAFLVGQLLDISVFNRLRKGRWWLAPGMASISASIVDTVIFFYLAFGNLGVSWIQLGSGDFCVKLTMDLVLLLPFRLLIWKGN